MPWPSSGHDEGAAVVCLRFGVEYDGGIADRQVVSQREATSRCAESAQDEERRRFSVSCLVAPTFSVRADRTRLHLEPTECWVAMPVLVGGVLGTCPLVGFIPVKGIYARRSIFTT